VPVEKSTSTHDNFQPPTQTNSRVKDELDSNLTHVQNPWTGHERTTYLVRCTNRVGIIEFLGVEGEAKGSLDTRAENLSVSWDKGNYFSDIILCCHAKVSSPKAMTPALLILDLI
jgi:hypothetical protein